MATAYPKTLGGIADSLHRLRAERMAMQDKVDVLRTKEKALREHALGEMAKERTETARGKLATITRVSREVPTVQDWEKVYKFVREHDATDLFERRIHRQAWRDRVEADGNVPGILPETVLDLHITSRKS